MDCITQVAFGIKVDAVKNPDTDFMKKCDVMFETWRFMIVALFTAVHGGLQGQVQLLFFFFFKTVVSSSAPTEPIGLKFWF